MIHDASPRFCALAGILAIFSLIPLSCLSAHAQGMNAYSNGRGGDLSNPDSLSSGVPSFQETIDFLTQKAAEDERERVTRENRFRTPTYGSEQLDDYFRRLSPTLKYRQYGREGMIR